MDEQMKLMKANKKVRLKAIKDLIQKHEIHNQQELLEKLKVDYHIDSNQSAISRDIDSLGLVKNKKTGFYTLSKEAEQKETFNQLAKWAKLAKAKSFDSSFEGLLFRTAPEHTDIAHLIASTIEKTFSTEDEPVVSFVNNAGFIWLLVSSKRKNMIQRNLNKIFQSE